MRTSCQEGKRYWESAGLDLAGYNVVEAAADVNDVRAALRYQTMMLSGTSFGSHWAMAVMRYHPQVVERAVISGLEGPDHTWDVPGHIFSTLERIAAAAEKHEALAVHIPEEGLIGALKVVFKRLHEAPVVLEVTDPETGDLCTVHLDTLAIQHQLLSGMSSGYGIREWPAKILALYDGDFQAAAVAHLKDSAPMTNATASFFLVDGASGVSRQRREKIDIEPAVAILGRINEAYRAASSIWNVDLGEDFRQDFETDIPTLLVQGTWDVNSPLENAEELAPLFKRGKLILVERGSHAALREANGTSEAFRDGLLEFLRNGSARAISDTVHLPAVQWRVPVKTDAVSAEPKAKNSQGG